MQSIENIKWDFFRWRRIANSHCVFFIQVGYIGRDSVRNVASDSSTNTTEPMWAMLIVDVVPRREPRGELIIDIIVEVQFSECPDVWVGRRNVTDEIFEMHSHIVVVVEQEREAISFDWSGFMPGILFSSQSWEYGCCAPFINNWSSRLSLKISLQHCRQEMLSISSWWSRFSFTAREEFVCRWVHWKEREVKGDERNRVRKAK